MDSYYLKQAETGLADDLTKGSLQHHRHLGRGFFSSALGIVTRALPFLGRTLLNTALNVSEEFKNKGENTESVKDALKKSAVAALDEGLENVKMTAKRKILGGGKRRGTKSRRRRKVGRPRKRNVLVGGGGKKSQSKKGSGRRKRTTTTTTSSTVKRRRRKSVKGTRRASRSIEKFHPHLYP